MTSTITLAANAVVGQIRDADDAAKSVVADLLSYQVEGAGFAGWSGASSFFSHSTNTFPAGFAHMVSEELKRIGYSVRRVTKPAPLPLGPENPIVDAFGNDDPKYDYQMLALKAVEQHKRGIIQIATGGGKSKVAKLIVARYRRPTLFLTTRSVLMYQMKEGFEDAALNVGVVGDSEWKPVFGVNVGMVQTFISRLKKPDLNAEIRSIISTNASVEEKRVKKIVKEFKAKHPNIPEAKIRERIKPAPMMARVDLMKLAQERFDRQKISRARTIKFLEMMEIVIGEEAHEAGGESYYEILKHCKNAHIRVALTATPFMRADAEDNMRLMAAFGPVLIKVSEEVLIQRGIFAKPYFMFANPPHAKKLARSTPYMRARELEIVNGEARNAWIVDLAVKAKHYGLPTLILVQMKEHGVKLRELLQDASVRVGYIRGENDQDERKRALGQLENREIDALIGSTIIDVGVDVPAIGLVILAGGGKAEVAHRQRIGRAARAKKFGPNVFFVADFQDTQNSYLKEHAMQRRAIVEETPGFVEGILPDGEDFPWELFENAA